MGQVLVECFGQLKNLNSLVVVMIGSELKQTIGPTQLTYHQFSLIRDSSSMLLFLITTCKKYTLF